MKTGNFTTSSLHHRSIIVGSAIWKAILDDVRPHVRSLNIEIVSIQCLLAFSIPLAYVVLIEPILLATSSMVVRSQGISRVQESATCSRENKHR
jgi:hypothetical protein